MVDPNVIQSTALLGFTVAALESVVRLRVRTDDGSGAAVGGLRLRSRRSVWRRDRDWVLRIFLASDETQIISGQGDGQLGRSKQDHAGLHNRGWLERHGGHLFPECREEWKSWKMW